MILKFNYNKKISNLINTRIDSKEQLWRIVLECSKLILIGNYVNLEIAEGSLVIDTEHRRIFFSQESIEGEMRHFSFQFPFKIVEADGFYSLRTYSQETDIQSAHIQVMLSLLDKGILSERRGFYGLQLEFCALIEDTLEDLFLSKSLTKDLDDILLELFLFEPSYIRFDEDSTNEFGKVHPLFHFDVFYSQQTTFKLGLKKICGLNNFMTFLCDKETNCFYLSE